MSVPIAEYGVLSCKVLQLLLIICLVSAVILTLPSQLYFEHLLHCCSLHSFWVHVFLFFYPKILPCSNLSPIIFTKNGHLCLIYVNVSRPCQTRFIKNVLYPCMYHIMYVLCICICIMYTGFLVRHTSHNSGTESHIHQARKDVPYFSELAELRIWNI